MGDHVGAIIFFVGDYAPQCYLFCDGTIYKKSDYPALFQRLGNIYGGDGVTTFAVPNLSGRVAMGQGTVPGTPLNLKMGKAVGEVSHLLTTSEMAAHNHNISSVSGLANSDTPVTMFPAQATIGAGRSNLNVNLYQNNTGSLTAMNSLVGVGLGYVHNNMQPYLGFNFIICAQQI